MHPGSRAQGASKSCFTSSEADHLPRDVGLGAAKEVDLPVSQELLEILICPNCHGEVVYDEGAKTITCQGTCRYVYPVRDDIPIMLIDEATKPGS